MGATLGGWHSAFYPIHLVSGGHLLGITCFVGVNSLFGTWGVAIGECRWDQAFFCISLTRSICELFLTLKWPCVTFLLGGKSVKYSHLLAKRNSWSGSFNSYCVLNFFQKLHMIRHHHHFFSRPRSVTTAAQFFSFNTPYQDSGQFFSKLQSFLEVEYYFLISRLLDSISLSISMRSKNYSSH